MLMMLVPSVWNGPLRAQSRPEGGYVVTQSGTEIAWERYAFTGYVLTSTLGIPSQQLAIDGTTRFDEGWSPVEYDASVRRFGDSTGFQRLRATFGDSVRWEVSGSSAQSGATAITRPFGLFRNLAFSHLATLIMRYDQTVGGEQTFNVWVPEGAAVVPTTLAVTGSDGTITLAGIAMKVHLSADGWLERIEVPSQQLVVEWRTAREMGDHGEGPAAHPKPPTGVRETDYRFTSGVVSLAGTLALPAAAEYPIPVAVIVAGSGPTDRDGNSSLGLRTDMYAQLAWRLAEHGIASLRYDKRGLGESGRNFVMSQTTIQDFARDAAAATEAMAADQRFGSVVMLGHSEGATLVTLAANEGAPAKGIALLAGMGRPFTVLLREQLADQLDSATLASYDFAMSHYLDGTAMPDGIPPSLQALFAPVNRRFVQSEAQIDPVAELRQVPVPVLIVQGATDIQISVRDAELLHQARPDATFLIIPDANHVFKRAPVRGRASQTQQYTDPSLPLVNELVDALVDWIRAVS